MSKSLRKAGGLVIYRKVFNEIQYLLLQASYENHHWTPPKGHLEENESDMDAAVRETEEEAGLKLQDLCVDHHFKKTLKYEPANKNFIKQVVYFLAYLTNPETPVKLSNEHQSYKWLSLQNAKEHAQYPEMQELLDECDKHLKL
ncbi:bis(5'-nucleosyl)-tetraphosphatase [asymmetrical] [Daktulosphaira vitifoliae]|uniref:bis(5'-nucleosyl)-tetraphosphatase [asymmetrical] n=1 Tax=Daktulosphaira vitifoliae TaxID=58002 RepID=UPI0021A9DE59|nr:bis(5'-nucleosyl)-tetraphosphatase [asymmetrical] [Daktulosphaira vitifoliae]